MQNYIFMENYLIKKYNIILSIGLKMDKLSAVLLILYDTDKTCHNHVRLPHPLLSAHNSGISVWVH